MRPVRVGGPYLRVSLLACSAFVSAPLAAQTTADAAPPASSGSIPTQNSGVGEIIVTAQKRAQNLQVVPVSITALDQKSLVANRFADFRDLSAIAPNLTVRVASGGTQQANYSMRGVVTSGSSPGTDKGVSVYLDGVYIQNVSGSIFDLADVERIEVLKGPQGTLFGRNSTAGAISIITHDPTGKFGARQELTYGNYDQFRSKTHIDLPKFGPFSASVTYMHSQRRGDTRNLGAGTVFDYSASPSSTATRVSPKYLGDQNIEAVSTAIKADLLDNLNLVYKFDYSENHFTPEAQGLAGIYTPGLGAATGGLLAGQIALQPNPSNLTHVTTHRPKAVNNAFSTPGFTSNMGHNLTAIYRFNDVVSVKNILAFRKSYNSSTYQLDGLGGLVNVITPAVGPIGAPFYAVVNDSYNKERQWSNETQLNIHTNWFTITAGYIHFHDHDRSGGFANVPNSINFQAIPNNVIPATGLKQTVVTVNSDAWYVQPELHLTDRLDLVGGARITKDRKQGVDNTVAGSGPQPIRYRNSQPTYLAGLNYRLTDHIFTYAKFATGYISGGYLATKSFAPETSRSYEGGIKTELFDRRLRANLAIFHVSYSNLQFLTSGLNVGVPGAAQVVINGGSGRAKGFEFESTVVPIDGLTLTGNVGYSDFHYTSVNPIIGNLNSYLPINRPKWTGNGAIEYDTRPVVGNAHLVFRGDVNYKSKTFLAYFAPTAAIAANTVTPHTWIVNGRVALAGLDVGGSKVDIALWGKNLTNNKQFSNISTFSFLFPGSFERARTYGVDLSFEL